MTETSIAEQVVCPTARKAEAIRYFKILGHEFNAGRTLPTAKCRYERWDGIEALADWAIDNSPPPAVPSQDQGVFLVINEIDEQSFLDFANGQGDGKTIADCHIARRTEFYVDVDPIRVDPLGGKVCATDAERAWAEAAMEMVLMVAGLHGFPEPLVVDSGNGFQIYYRVDLPNDDASKKLIKGVLEAFAKIIDCDLGTADKSVGNASRLARIPGTYNRKGNHTAERPHRLATIIRAPADDALTVISPETLEAFVATIGAADGGSAKRLPGQPEICRLDLDETTFSGVVHDIVDYLKIHDAPPVQQIVPAARHTKIELSYCPFKGPAHQDGDPAVLAWRSGGIGFKCFHDKCEGRGWDALQALVEGAVPKQDARRICQIQLRQDLAKSQRPPGFGQGVL